MPKRTLTLNGFGGGINLDADTADIPAVGSSVEDECARPKNLFLDRQGKIIAEYPTSSSATGVATISSVSTPGDWTNGTYATPFTASGGDGTGILLTCVVTGTNPTFTIVHGGEGYTVGNTLTVATSSISGTSGTSCTFNVASINSSITGVTEDSTIYDSSAERVLLYNDILYRAEGVYKHGEVILYNKYVDYMSFGPTTGTLGALAPAAQTDGIDLWFRPDRRPVEDTNVDGTNTWPGKGAKGSINIFLGTGCRGWGSQSVNNGAVLFDKQIIYGPARYVRFTEKLAGGSGVTTGTLGAATERAELWHITNTIGDFQMNEPAQYSASPYYGSFETYPQHPSTEHGLEVSGGVQVVATGSTAFTFSNENTDDEDNELIDLAHKGFDNTEAEAESLDDAKAFHLDTLYLDTLDCVHSQASNNDVNGVENTSLRDFLFCKMHGEGTDYTAWGSENGEESTGEEYFPPSERTAEKAWATAPVLWFGVGKWDPNAIGGGDGYYGQYCPTIEGKIMRLQIKVFTGGMVVGDGIEGIYVVAHTGSEQNLNTISDNAASSYSKTWYISRSTLMNNRNENDGNSGWSEVEIPVSNHLYQGSNYEGDDKIHSFLIWPKLTYSDVNELAADKILMKLREFSFVDEITSGWAAYDYVKLFQTKIANGIESLPVAYTTTNQEDGVDCPDIHKIRTDSQEMFLRKPHANTTCKKGKIYFQGCDEKGVVFGEKYLLAEYDYLEGVRWAGTQDQGYQAWAATLEVPFGMNPQGDTSAISQVYRFEDPPVESTFSLETGYPDGAETINALFKTAAVVGRQVFIGNVAKQKPNDSSDAKKAQPFITGTTSADDDFVWGDSYVRWGTNSGDTEWADHGYSEGDSFVVTGGETSGTNANYNKVFTITSISNYQANITPTPTSGTDDTAKTIFGFEGYDPSLLLKTPAGQASGFPDNLYIDLEFGGDEITVLESTADRLLVFSKHKLTIINVAQDVEFVEATMDFMGIEKHRQIVKVGEGFAWVNSSGVFHFDGQQVNPISGLKLSAISNIDDYSDGWNDSTSAIAYDPSRDLLWVWINNEKIFYFCFITRSWVGFSNITSPTDFYDVPTTNVVAGPLGYAHYAKGSTANRRQYFLGVNTNLDVPLDRDFLWESGKIHCGSMGVNKRFYDVYITTKDAANAVQLQWSTDGTNFYTAYVDGYKGQSTNDNDGLIDSTVNAGFGYGTTRCGLSNQGAAPKAVGKYIILRIIDIGNAAKSSFEIGDMSIIFREKTVK